MWNNRMMSAVFSLICSSIVMLSPDLRAENGGNHGAGNGGDLVECKASPENAFRGIYSLDFLLTYRKPTPETRLAEVKDWAESSERILKLLRDKTPKLAESFASFAADVENQTSYYAAHIWEPASFGLIDIQDENMLNLLPANCRGLQKSGDHSLIQGVIRSQKGEKTFYQYDEDRLARLKKTKALQYSFLMVHEWLWDLTTDVQLIRKVNRLVHSTQFDAMSKSEFSTYMYEIGMIKLVQPKPGIYASSRDSSCARKFTPIGANRLRMEVVNHPKRDESCFYKSESNFTCRFESWAGGTACRREDATFHNYIVQSETSLSESLEPKSEDILRLIE